MLARPPLMLVGMEVLVSDIDGTVLDVTRRIEAVLDEIGAPQGTDSRWAADALKGKMRSRFFDVFLSEKYTHLDTPIPAGIAMLEEQMRLSGLPLVLLTGRPSSMRKSTRKAIAETGLAYEELVMRPRHQQMQRTTEFKVQALQSRQYEPKIALDDDAEILSAFAASFPAAKLYLVTGETTTPWPD